jgi:hypothetical protein
MIFRFSLLCLVLMLTRSGASADVALPRISSSNIFNVTNSSFSAVGDGVTTNTTAIQLAINAAAGGGNANGSSGGRRDPARHLFVRPS